MEGFIINKLILVEGIPGVGKTTTARKIKEELISEGKDVIIYEKEYFIFVKNDLK